MADQPGSTDEPVSNNSFDAIDDGGVSPFAMFEDVLKPLSSLKLTVLLFACSMILVMAGTLAQVDLDIWDVVREYFRCWFAWMPSSVWYPLFARIELFDPIKSALENSPEQLGIWFPGGYLLGTLMAVNLLAAHLLKFKVQAKGNRLAAGIVVTAIGCVATWMVIASGDGTGLQQTTEGFYDKLWFTLKILLGVLLAFNIGGAASAVRRGKSESPPLTVCKWLWRGSSTGCCLKWIRFNSSSMRILWQLVKAEMAALILLGGCHLLFKKRAGVTLLHAGVALVMINEVVVDSLHVETQMAIEEGHTVNFAKDIREIEFVVIDKSSPDFDEEIVIPRSLVLAAGAAEGQNGKVISNSELPFDIEILEFMQNSNIEDAKPGAENRATAGAGLQLISESAKPTTGTDSSGRVDLTAAYVRIIDKASKEDLGTYLTGVVFELLGKNESQRNLVTVDGKEWEIAMRFRRYYKPYSVRLSDVSKKDYIGTNTPMDYRSIVDVIDAESGEVLVDNRHIWMNNPMRYSGDTFYQSNYSPPNPRTGEKEITTLSVVSNTGWMLPYTSCMIVGTGMLAHFFFILLRFLNRRTRQSDSRPAWAFLTVLSGQPFNAAGDHQEAEKVDTFDKAASESDPSGSLARAIPIVLTLLIAGWLFSKARMPSAKDGQPDLYAFGKLPVVYQGRVKPLDTVARNSLRALSNREEFRLTRPILLFADSFDRDSNKIVSLAELNEQAGGLFNDADSDSNDEITRDDLTTARDTIAGPLMMISQVFSVFDADANEVLTQAEVKKGLETLFERMGAGAGAVGLESTLQRVTESFSKLDSDGNGRIDQPELNVSDRIRFLDKSFAELNADGNETLSRTELNDGLKELFEMIDSDGNLEINEEELLAYRWSEPGEKRPAIAWLLDLISGSESISDHAVFRVDNPQIIEKLKLERRKRHLYSLNEISENRGELADDVAQARSKEADNREPFDTHVLALERKSSEFELLHYAFNLPNFGADHGTRLQGFLQALSQNSPPLAIPPSPPESDSDEEAGRAEWQTVSHALFETAQPSGAESGKNDQLRLFGEILDAHLNEDPAAFNKAVSEYQKWLDDNAGWLQSQLPPTQSLARTGFESFYNHFSPFYYSAWAYLFAFVLTAIGLLGWTKPLNRSAFLIILVTLAVHTFALGARIYISGRPPVTNLYSSAVFIGWGCVIAGLVFEALFKLGIGNLIASALGAAALGISHLLSGDGDTFAVLQAVLDTQFWLATHVVLITLGYSATFLAGHLGIVQIIVNLVSPSATDDQRKDLTRMIYGTVCFGMFFSFVGTVLGGLWADDSWGRFWGWDPKENGALLIVIWNALLLHARWDRLVSDRGFANLAIAGNIVTSWSWFGVNELGIGLHSYGFTDGVWLALWIYWISQVVLIAAGLIPWRKPATPTGDA